MNVIKWMDEHIEELLLFVFSFIMVFVIAMQVFMRFVLSSSLTWSEELARYCFIWMVYIGISYGVKRQQHIKVDAALLLLKDKGKTILGILANLIFLAFAVVIIIHGYELAQRLLTFGQITPALQIPMGLIYMATPIGMGLTVIRIIQRLIQQVKSVTEQEQLVVERIDHELDSDPLKKGVGI